MLSNTTAGCGPPSPLHQIAPKRTKKKGMKELAQSPETPQKTRDFALSCASLHETA
jgi:hypothetical protein